MSSLPVLVSLVDLKSLPLLGIQCPLSGRVGIICLPALTAASDESPVTVC